MSLSSRGTVAARFAFQGHSSCRHPGVVMRSRPAWPAGRREREFDIPVSAFPAMTSHGNPSGVASRSFHACARARGLSSMPGAPARSRPGAAPISGPAVAHPGASGRTSSPRAGSADSGIGTAAGGELRDHDQERGFAGDRVGPALRVRLLAEVHDRPAVDLGRRTGKPRMPSTRSFPWQLRAARRLSSTSQPPAP
jgi:hypothetical protein